MYPRCNILMQYSTKPFIPSLHFFYSISIKISINFTIVTLSSSSWLPAILHQPSWNFWEFQLWSPVNKPLPRQYQVLNNIYLTIIIIIVKAKDHYHTIKNLNRSKVTMCNIYKTLPKAHRTRGLSSSCQSTFLKSYQKFKHKSWSWLSINKKSQPNNQHLHKT